MCDRWVDPNSWRVAERRAYVFPDRGDGRNFGACVAREIASARRGTRKFWIGGNAGKHSCRERSVEAENAQCPGSCRVLGGWNRAVDCRERSTEAENALLPCFAEGSEVEERFKRSTAENARRRQRTLYPPLVSKARFADSADRNAGWRAKWNLLQKILFLYGKNRMFEHFRRSSVSFVASFPHADNVERRIWRARCLSMTFVIVRSFRELPNDRDVSGA